MIANSTIRKSLIDLGYRTGNVVARYRFAALEEPKNPIRETELAAFFEGAPSYRNAALAVVRVKSGDNAQQTIEAQRSLGAPFLLAVDSRRVSAWVMTPDGARQLDSASHENWQSFVTKHAGTWRAEAVRRLKAVGVRLGDTDRQALLFDPAVVYGIQKQVQLALDELLKQFLAFFCEAPRKSALSLNRDREVLFPLVFRLLAGKVLCDRGDPRIASVDSNKVRAVIDCVSTLYSLPPLALQWNTCVETQLSSAWSALAKGVFVRNIAADDLAFIYENTLITPETRRAMGTHSTPTAVADYIVRSFDLPEGEALQQLRVYEPFAGSCVFLTAAMRRFKELLPQDWTAPRQHRHLVSHFAASELDQFASEIARLSLILADYPNANGWRVHNEDLFDGQTLAQRAANADMVICNPPFEDFVEESHSTQSYTSVHKPVEVLSQLLNRVPPFLGIVMPSGFNSHNKYRALVERCVAQYQDVEVLTLPENTFSRATVGAVALIAQSPRINQSSTTTRLRQSTIQRSDFSAFEQTLRPSSVEVVVVDSVQAPGLVGLRPLRDVWESLRENPTLGDSVDIHRGLEWKGDQRLASSPNVQSGYRAGLHRLNESLSQFRVLQVTQLNCRPADLRGGAGSLPWLDAKVICSAVRRTRSPWRIAAVVDDRGLVLSQQFFGMWPKLAQENSSGLYALSAILNSPLANAYSFIHDPEQRLRKTVMDKLPLPVSNLAPSTTRLIEEYATQSLQDDGPLFGASTKRLNDLLLAIDADVLSAYDLHPRHERALLGFMGGQGRPCGHDFGAYPSGGQQSAIPLNLALRVQREQTKVREAWLAILSPLHEDIADVFEAA